MSHQVQEASWTEEPKGLPSDLNEYLGLLRRRWWLIVGSAILCAGWGWSGQRGRLPIYTAEVLLQQRGEAPVVGVGMNFTGNGNFLSQSDILRSRAVLAPVMDSLGLRLVFSTHANLRTALVVSVDIEADDTSGAYYLEERSAGEWTLINARTQADLGVVEPDGSVEGPGFNLVLGGLDMLSEPLEFSIQFRELALQRLQGGILVEPGGGPDLMRVAYRSADPRLAAAVVNAVARSFQSHRASDARGAAARRKTVVAAEMETLADSVRRAQAALESYQSGAQLLDPNVEGTALMSALLDTENELRRLRFEEGLLESLVEGLRSADTEDESLARIMALGSDLVPAGPGLHQRLQDFQAERRGLTASRFGVTDSSPDVEVLDAQIASTQQQMRVTAEQSLALLGTRLSAAESRISSLRGQMGTLPARSSEYDRLRQQADAVQEVFDRLVGSYYEAQISEGVEAGDVTVVDPAPVPIFPNPSPVLLNILAALAGGVFVGALAAFLVEHMDTRVRRAAEAERASGLRVVGTIPSIGSRASNSRSAIMGIEAFRGLRTNVQFASGDRRLLGICSSGPAEGKSTVAVNLALALAEKGEDVIIVDADLRRARVHELSGVVPGPGLSEVLSGDVSLKDAVYISALHPSVHVLPAGMGEDPDSGFSDERELQAVLGQLHARYDRVLVDMPPILAVSDASVVANMVEGNLIVVRANGTDSESLEACVEQLRRVNAPLLGVILNDARADDAGYSAYYDSYYGDRSKRRRKALIAAKT